MPRTKLESVSPDGKYGLNWSSRGEIQVVEMATGEDVFWLVDNYRWILRAVFSHDMRRILCLNADGTVGIWSMPKENIGPLYRNVVEHIVCSHVDPNNYFSLRGVLPPVGNSPVFAGLITPLCAGWKYLMCRQGKDFVGISEPRQCSRMARNRLRC